VKPIPEGGKFRNVKDLVFSLPGVQQDKFAWNQPFFPEDSLRTEILQYSGSVKRIQKKAELHQKKPVPGPGKPLQRIEKEREKLVPLQGLEDILVDHVASGVVKPGALFLLLDIGHEREFHVNTRGVAEHLLEFNLLGVHEECIRDL